MTNAGWLRLESPFHAGERAIHDRFGLQKRMEQQGRRMVREHLTDQHQQFVAQLAYVIVGTVDAADRPWTSILVGAPGFLTAPNDGTLQVTAQPLFGDPLATTIIKDMDIGLLGIELHTRRRNRLNGKISEIRDDGFDVQIRQSFGNCPQYIQDRMFALDAIDPTLPKTIDPIVTFGTAERSMITAADTFFITTAYQDPSAGAAKGVDVSHRGGKPGFVRIDDDRTLTIPDFSGNFHFNTFGNLALNPNAGLLFLDFNQGHLLYLTGTAEVIWEGAEIRLYEGAERLLRFHLDRGYRVEKSLPLRWSEPEFSPFLDRMGNW